MEIVYFMKEIGKIIYHQEKESINLMIIPNIKVNFIMDYHMVKESSLIKYYVIKDNSYKDAFMDKLQSITNQVKYFKEYYKETV